MQPAAIAESAETEGSGTDFTVEAPPEDELEAAGPEAVPAEGLATDPLQMLIEDLSGITGALREATPRPPDGTAAEAMLTKAASSAAVPPSDMPLEARIGGTPLDPAQADATADAPRGAFPWGILDITAPETPVEGAAAPSKPGDMSLAGAEALLADPTAGLLPAPLRDEGVVPAEPRLAKATIVPVARQIAEAVVTARDDLVEIALAPEELGKIRMVLSGPDHNPHVTVWVERPEVLDQLRRNAAFLQECLGDAGMPEASFEFQGDTPSDSRKDRPTAASTGFSPAFEAAEPARTIPVAWTPMAVPARLDIRI
ncbi:flagellar hook-length control protein FliK [Paracoccus lichenicola]|uniref:flagellar hook-length control protein FliK n=1 Tax=Paracoccus lichenicola TaxID=2665644 RepID=UPI0018AB5F7F|nr:flagellar hook-length control protein FliK [Paracoccus lichenicola]